jgi:hypothetical protein
VGGRFPGRPGTDDHEVESIHVVLPWADDGAACPGRCRVRRPT